MALSKNIKMYLMLFVATTCVYMVLYQYHIARETLPSPELIKNKLVGAENAKQRISTASLVKRYNIFLWSPLSLMTSHGASASASALKRTTPPSSLTLSTLSPSSSSSSSSASLQTSSSSSSPSVAPSLESASTALASNQTSTQHSVAPLGSISSVRNMTTTNTTTTTSTTTTTTTVTTTTSQFNNHSKSHEIDSNNNKNNNNNKLNTIAKNATETRTTTKIAKPFVAAQTPPPLYIITPTYKRPEQSAELTRLGYTLKHISNLLWLVIEDANKTSPLVTETLNRIGVPFEYLVAPMPEEYKKTKKAKPRGVSNRNRGLQWLRQNATDGVFYFADDDNTYDISIFEQMRYTKKVSMWPVGLVTKFGVSSPIIKQGKIVGFYDGWIGGRKYPVDMAGFAVSVKFLHDRPGAKMPYKPGYEEDGFLKSLAPLNHTEIELLASECTEILTWHTQTKKNGAAQPLNMTKYGDTNLVRIDKNLIRT